MRTRIIGIGLAGALVGALAVAGGCGGGERSSERARVRERDERGVRTREPRDRADHGPDLDAPVRMSKQTARVVAIHRESVDSLRALAPAEGLRATAKLWIALVDQSLDELDAMRAALRGGTTARGEVVRGEGRRARLHDRR